MFITVVMEAMAVWAHHLPIFLGFICSVVVLVVNLKNEKFLLPAAAFTLGYLTTVSLTALSFALLAGRVSAESRVEGPGALPSAKATTLLPASWAVIEWFLAPLTRFLDTWLLARVCAAPTEAWAALHRASGYFARLVTDHKVIAARYTDAKTVSFITSRYPSANLPTVTLLSVSREHLATRFTTSVWFHGNGA